LARVEGVRGFVMILAWATAIATAIWGQAGATAARGAEALVEEVEAHFVVLAAETDLAGARAAWADGAFAVITPGTVLPVAGLGEHLWTRMVWRNPAAEARHVEGRIVDTFQGKTTFYSETGAGEIEVKRAGENVSLAERYLGRREPGGGVYGALTKRPLGKGRRLCTMVSYVYR
jgi:hypothetical protein